MSGIKRMDEVKLIEELAGPYHDDNAGPFTTILLGRTRSGKPFEQKLFKLPHNVAKLNQIRASGRTWLSVYSVVRRFLAKQTGTA